MQALRDLLRAELGRSLRPLPALDRLGAAWPVACGRTMAGHGVITAFTDGTLYVAVDDPAWLDEFRHRGPALRAELARIAAAELREIHFSLNK